MGWERISFGVHFVVRRGVGFGVIVTLQVAIQHSTFSCDICGRRRYGDSSTLWGCHFEMHPDLTRVGDWDSGLGWSLGKFRVWVLGLVASLRFWVRGLGATPFCLQAHMSIPLNPCLCR